jgi:IPT/TIG domain
LLFAAGIIVALPVAMSTNVAAASTVNPTVHSAPVAHVVDAPSAPSAPPKSSAHTPAGLAPILPLNAQERTAAKLRKLKRGGSAPVSRLARGAAAGGESAAELASRSATAGSKAPLAPLVASTAPDLLTGFPGTSQASAIHNFGDDQEITPPNEDVAAGPTDIVEVVNSTMYIYSRAGADLGSVDLNLFMDVFDGYYSSDPRVIYDPGDGRFWVTVTEVPDEYQSPSDCPESAPVLIAVSGSSNPLPFDAWTVYGLPMETFGGSTGQPLTEFADQPGLGMSQATIVVTFDDYTCDNEFNGSETDVLQKSDFESDSGLNSLDFFYDGPFAEQPVEAQGEMTVNYIVSNQSDCSGNGCMNNVPDALVQGFTGTPEGAGGVTNGPYVYVPMSATAVDDSTGFLPPADQKGTTQQLQTNDDRFLNAVYRNGEIWTADGTSCEPSGDTMQRDCLDYVEIQVGGDDINFPPALTNQIDNVGIDGADLFYPAVSLDQSGNMITVFDESSTNLFPSIEDASVTSASTTLSTFQTLHTSITFYNGADLFSGACDSNGCRWGDYSGAAMDPSNPNDVWVVSGSADGNTSVGCPTINACWNTRIYDLTLTAPTVTSLNPSDGPVAGGQTVTATGLDFGTDTTATFGGASITINNVTPTTFTFVTPPSGLSGGTDNVVATDELGSNQPNAVTYTYIGLANYIPVTPYRILDTRTTGGPLGPGAIRQLQVTDVGSGTQIPPTATAAVLNVTEVSGSASSLLTIYPAFTTRPNASNLNFVAHTVIANLVTVTLGNNGGPQEWVDIYNALGSVNVLVDVEGYFTPDVATDPQGLFHPIAPIRVCDTRHPSPTPNCSAHGALGGGESMEINFTTAGGLPSDGSAEAAVVNLTGVAGNASTFLSLFPTDSSGQCPYGPGHAPSFSMINLLPGAVQANRVMVALGPSTPSGGDDALCVYNAVGTINVLVDANGWYGSSSAPLSPAGYQFQALPPTRICDTRVSSFPCTEGAIGAALSRLTPVAGAVDIPSKVSSTIVAAVIANLTAVAPTAKTYLTLYPANLTRAPGVSDLNVNAGEVLPNLVVVQLDTTGDANDGKVYLYNGAGSVNAIIDIEGWFQ